MFKKTLIAAAIASLSGGAFAESQMHNTTQGMYMGGGVGMWSIDESGFEDTAMSGRVSGGFKFNEFVAIEGSYLFLGEAEDDFTVVTGGIPASAELKVDGTGWELAVRPSYPFTDSLEGYARLGWGYYDMEAEISATVSGVGSVSVSDSDSDDGFVWALGGAWALNDNLSLFGEYSQPDIEADVYVMTFGATYNF